MPTFNAAERAEVFANWLEDYSSCYATDQLFILFGMDFHYMNAFENYENMDKLINYMNANYGDKYIFKYATPGNYLDHVNAIKDREWPTKYEDLMPYGDQSDSWWTGYFSSRPNAKSYVRYGSRQLHASDQLRTQALLDVNISEDEAKKHLDASNLLTQEMGIYQHHDAIAGTAKQAVADDYALRLTKGLKKSADSISDILNSTIPGFKLEEDGLFEICDRVNGTFVDCPINNYDLSKSTYVVIQNPSSNPIKMAEISLPSGKFKAQELDYYS